MEVGHGPRRARPHRRVVVQLHERARRVPEEDPLDRLVQAKFGFPYDRRVLGLLRKVVRLLYRRGERQNAIEVLSLIDREDLDRYVRQAKTRA